MFQGYDNGYYQGYCKREYKGYHKVATIIDYIGNSDTTNNTATCHCFVSVSYDYCGSPLRVDLRLTARITTGDFGFAVLAVGLRGHSVRFIGFIGFRVYPFLDIVFTYLVKDAGLSTIFLRVSADGK